jgi:predicted phosphohydrolase
MKTLRIALTADLHYGTRHESGRQATLQLASELTAAPPDLLILAGDIGAGADFGPCLDLFGELICLKVALPGNHDVWTTSTDTRGDSERVYRELLPAMCAERGFHYLDHGPLVLPDYDLAIVGGMNWYDYSWAVDELREKHAGEEWRFQKKVFSRGKHNDVNYVRWKYTDESFTQETLARLITDFDEALSKVSSLIVVAHHPPIQALNYPSEPPRDLDTILWRGFSGNSGWEQAIQERADRIRYLFCGHTHFAVDTEWMGIRAHNIGGDYHFKRLLTLDWPNGELTAKEFHASSAGIKDEG